MDLDEMLHGKEDADNRKQFFKEIEELTDKYKDKLNKGDNLKNYIVFSAHREIAQFGFNETNRKPLTEQMKADMLQIFQKHFPKSKPFL